jgi:ribosome-associated protein
MVKQSVKQNNSMDLASVISEAMFDKKASKIIVMDMRSIGGTSFDVFVICEAVSAIQVKAIADGVEEAVFKQLHEHPLHSEGFTNAEWILLDYGNVVVHVFQERIRAHINLEELWSDAKATEPKDKKIVAKPTAIKKSTTVKSATAKKSAVKTTPKTKGKTTAKTAASKSTTKSTKAKTAKKPATKTVAKPKTNKAKAAKPTQKTTKIKSTKKSK